MTSQLPILNRNRSDACALHPEKIIQFGTGNFLKGFVNLIVQQLNDKTGLDAGVVAVKLRAGNEQQIEAINSQQGLFTVNIRGLKQGSLVDSYKLVTVQNRALSPYQDYAAFISLAESPTMEWVVSNTTEAGIVFDKNDQLEAAPPETFPGKLAALLWHRYIYFDGGLDKGLKIFCCELIDNNAAILKGFIKQYAELWQLDNGFLQWLDQSCCFYNTLVDRIVTGKPADASRLAAVQQQLGYIDQELIESESYYQWVIEADKKTIVQLQQFFPVSAGLNIILTDNLQLYRQRKVRILNGAHSGCVALAMLLNLPTVYQSMQDGELCSFMRQLVYDEISPTIDMPADELKIYADSILERFENPFLHHEWRSIALNSLSKWRARVLPVLLDCRRDNGSIPVLLTTSWAALILLYRGHYQSTAISLQDNTEHINLLQDAWKQGTDTRAVTEIALSAETIWGEDYSGDDELVDSISAILEAIEGQGLRSYLQHILNQ